MIRAMAFLRYSTTCGGSTPQGQEEVLLVLEGIWPAWNLHALELQLVMLSQSTCQEVYDHC